MVGTAWALEGGTGCTEQERERATRGDSEGRREGFFYVSRDEERERLSEGGREREREREREWRTGQKEEEEGQDEMLTAS